MKTILLTLLVLAIIAVVGVGIGTNLKECVQCAFDVDKDMGGFGVNMASSTWSYPDSVLPNRTVLKSQSGILSSIVVTTAGTAGGETLFLDATSTSALIKNSTTTSKILSIPNDLAVGEYNFNVPFNTSLLVYYDGSIGTSTILWE